MSERPGLSGSGEVKAEIAQGFRNAVTRGDISVEKALVSINRAFRELDILALAAQGTIPFEEGSTQLKELIEEAKRLREGTSYFGDLTKKTSNTHRGICL